MMLLPNLDQIEKYLKKHNKDLSETEIKVKADALLNNYMESNKERIEQAKIEDKLLFEEALEKESLHLWLALKIEKK